MTEQLEQEIVEFLKYKGIVVDKCEVHLTFELYAAPAITIEIEGFTR